jgi:hypothetical protein
MTETLPRGSAQSSNPWPLVLCLVGVDYFSTLAYLPSIAVEAAGPVAPVAAGAVVLVTFLLALPIYWHVVGRSPNGRGATGLLEDLIPGWRGKLVVLTLLGFAAADFVITRSLSLADAAIHLLHNPHGQRLLERLPAGLLIDDHVWWGPVEHLLRRLVEPQVAITLGLSILSFAAWQLLKRGIDRRILFTAAIAVACYLILCAVVIGSALVYVARHPEIFRAWLDAVFASRPAAAGVPISWESSWPWAWLKIALWSFPQMALGLSGFEMIMTLVPRVRGNRSADALGPAGRVRNTRKLMFVAVSIMSVYLLSAVVVTTLLVPHAELMLDGAAEHRALAYLAHGLPLADHADGTALNPMFGHRFGDLFDLSSVLILCLAGASVTMGLQSLLPHYLNRFGMEVSWAGKVGVILHVLNAIVLLVTVVFRANLASQQWAYATSVMVLLAGAALAATKDLLRPTQRTIGRLLFATLAGGAGAFFLAMTAITVLINHSGLTIALAFVAAILVSSFISRWIRSTELRFEGFDFAEEASRQRWNELCNSGAKVLVPHRPGLVALAEKSRRLQQDYYLDPAVPVIFIEATLAPNQA